MPAKTIQLEIPAEVIEWAKEKHVPESKLIEFTKANVHMDLLMLTSQMDTKKAESLSKKIGKAVWTRL